MSVEVSLVPADLGLPPAKFARFRRGQVDAIMALVTSEKRATLMSMPTGGGKSPICIATANTIKPRRTLVLTGTKNLQLQYSGDFAVIGMTDIRGKNNYVCRGFDEGEDFFGWERPGTRCNEGPCNDGEECSLKAGGCTYYDDVRRARRARLVISNYSYWMSLNRYSDPESIGQFDMLILDEAHTAPDHLSDFCAIEINRLDVRELLDMSLPPLDDDQETWCDWAAVALKVCREQWTLTKLGGLPRSIKRKAMRRLTVLGQGLAELAKGGTSLRRAEPSDPVVSIAGARTDWVAERTTTGLLFSPVWAHAYAEEYLFTKIPRILLVSATLQPAVMRYLGLDPATSEFREFASTFDPRRRPLTWLPTTTIDRNSTEGQVRVWVNKIDAIIDGRLDRKGIIHTRSYDRAQMIMDRSRHRQSGLLLTHNSRTTRDVIEKFKRSSGGKVLVSPSLEEGYDFPHDECRYQIIAKVPFVDTRSSIVRARAKSDKTYLNYLTALSLIQMVGRGMRAEDDWCENFIIDDNINWFWAAARKQNLFPTWFTRAYHRGTSIPPAMSRP